MNERYLFRGKRTEPGEWNKKWVQGHLIIFNKGRHMIARRLNELSNEVSYDEVDPDTVGQCPALRDKNGVLAWEGDIIKTHYANAIKSDHTEVIVFKNGRFCGECKIGETGKSWAVLADGVSHVVHDKSVYMESFEVIGNIWDNPELLKEAK